MKIKKFYEFVLENFKPKLTDNEILKAKKNSYNKNQLLIKKFNDDKNRLKAIYMNYTDDLDLVNRLFNAGFILSKSKDPKKMSFKNEFIEKLAEIAANIRKSKDLEKIAKGNNDDLESYKQQIADADNSTSVIDSTNAKIETTKKRLEKNKESAKEIEIDSNNTNTEIRKDMERLKSEQSKTKREIEEAEKEAMSNPAELASGEEEVQSTEGSKPGGSI